MVFKGYFSPMLVLNCVFKYILIAFSSAWLFRVHSGCIKPFMRAHEFIPACQYFLPLNGHPRPPTQGGMTYFPLPHMVLLQRGALKASQEHVWREGMAQKDEIQVLDIWIDSETSQLARLRGCQASGKQFITSFSLFKTKLLSQPICIVHFIQGGRHTPSKKSKLKPSFEFALWL